MSLLKLFYHVDTFCQTFLPQWEHQLRQQDQRMCPRPSQLVMSELITILIYSHHMRFRDFKTSYLAYVLGHLQREFSQAVSYHRFVDLMSSTLGPLCTYLQTYG